MPTALVTGGNRGLGLTTAQKLAKAGFDVAITTRNPAEGEAARSQIRAATGKEVEVLSLDQMSRASIDALAATLNARASAGRPLDLLLCNAGYLGGDGSAVVDDKLVPTGCERTFATNALGTILVARALLPALRASQHPRVIFVGSRTHLRLKPGEISLDDVDSRTDPAADGSKRYARSKLALMWLVRAFARRTAPIPVHVVCPGLVPETAAPRTSGFTRVLMTYVLPLFPFSHSREDATDSMLWACVDPSLDRTTGLFLAEKKVIAASHEADDVTLQDAMWKKASAMLGITESV